jgi:hypothetical protein
MLGSLKYCVCLEPIAANMGAERTIHVCPRCQRRWDIPPADAVESLSRLAREWNLPLGQLSQGYQDESLDPLADPPLDSARCGVAALFARPA